MSESATLQTASESDLGLEPNETPEAPAEGAEEPTAEALGTEVQDALDDEQEDDNVVLAQRAEERRQARLQSEPGAEGQAATEGTEAEGGEAEGGEGGEEAEAGAEEGAEGEEAQGEGGEGIDPAQAQAYLDYLLENYGDTLALPFKANGEEKRATLKELREQIAPGYMGQDGVHRTFQEATRAREAAEARAQEVTQIIEAAQRDIRAYAEAPDKWVDEFLIPQGGVDALRALRDHVEQQLDEIESNPSLFQLRQEMRREREEFRTLLTQRNGTGQAAEAEPDAKAQGAEQSQVPEDFGFVPGQGIPQPYVQAAWTALTRASKAVGVDPEAVLDAWERGRKSQDPFDVLTGIVQQRTRNAPKVDLARKPPMKPVPKGGGSGGRKTKLAPQRQAWNDIEGNLARAIQAANVAG